jgi:DNA processing protein
VTAVLDGALPWLRLLRAKGLKNAEALALLAHLGSAAAVCEAAAAAWRRAGVDRSRVALPPEDDAGVQADLGWLAADARHHLLSRDDARYPEALRAITQPPLALFVAGDAELLAQPQLAVVGARAATPQGLENAHAFAAALSRCGLVITSGLAAGVDGAAHQGALAASGATLAVCGTGLDRVYPARHQALAREIFARNGALVSEFPLGTPSVPANFPRRNRIISGLALGVLVVEASRDSGSLITARRALEQGREVFAIPGSIHNPLAKGCHQLIREGAKLTESADDILLELAPRLGGWLKASAPPAAGAPSADLSSDEARLLALLADVPCAVDGLIERSGLDAATVSAALLHLELAGRVAVDASGRIMRLQAA